MVIRESHTIWRFSLGARGRSIPGQKTDISKGQSTEDIAGAPCEEDLYFFHNEGNGGAGKQERLFLTMRRRAAGKEIRPQPEWKISLEIALTMLQEVPRWVTLCQIRVPSKHGRNPVVMCCQEVQMVSFLLWECRFPQNHVPSMCPQNGARDSIKPCENSKSDRVSKSGSSGQWVGGLVQKETWPYT